MNIINKHEPSMQDISTYIHYLPSVLAESRNDSTNLLGIWLRIFEKLLTGIDDQIPIPPVKDAARYYTSLAELIARLPELTNPWQAPPEMLRYLSDWLEMEFSEKRFGASPTEIEEWSDYQQRKLLADLSFLHRQRGTREGLYRYLDQLLPQQRRPRIVIDTGEAILAAHFTDDDKNQLEFDAPIVTHLIDPLPGQAGEATPVVVRPVSLAVDGDNLIVVDLGTINTVNPKIVEQIVIWKIPINPAQRQNMKPEPLWRDRPDQEVRLQTPVAVVVLAPKHYLILDRDSTNSTAALYSLQAQNDIYELKLVSLPNSITLDKPIDMVLYQQQKENWLIILYQDGTDTRLFLGQINNEGNEVTTAKTTPPLGMQTPTALALWPKPTNVNQLHLLIVDAAAQSVKDNELQDLIDHKVNVMSRLAPELFHIHIELSNASVLTELRLLANDKLLSGKLGVSPLTNPLVYPNSLLFVDNAPDAVLVCDLGIKGDVQGLSVRERVLAKQPMIYRINLLPNTNIFTPLGGEHQLVKPQKMVWNNQMLFIANEGGLFSPAGTHIDWRVRMAEFGVIVNFASAHLPPTTAQRETAIDPIWRKIEEIVTKEKPAHTHFWMISK